MDDRIAFLRDRLPDFEDYFNVLITRPSRYVQSEIDVSIRFDSIACTADMKCAQALDLVPGDTIVISATIYPPDDILTPIAMCSVFCSGHIADWLEVRLRDGSLDEGECDDDAYLRVRLRILFGDMSRIEQVSFPMHGKAYIEKPVDCLEIVHIYDESYQNDWEEEYYDSYDYDDEEDDFPLSQDEDE